MQSDRVDANSKAKELLLASNELKIRKSPGLHENAKVLKYDGIQLNLLERDKITRKWAKARIISM